MQNIKERKKERENIIRKNEKRERENIIRKNEKREREREREEKIYEEMKLKER